MPCRPATPVCVTDLTATRRASLLQLLSVNSLCLASTLTDAQLADFKLFSQYAGAAYCNGKAAAGSVITCGGDVCPDVTASNATIVTSFRCGSIFHHRVSDALTGLVHDNSGVFTDIEGFVAIDRPRKLVILSFRGTTSIKSWIVK
jgi:hypothetical protein